MRRIVLLVFGFEERLFEFAEGFDEVFHRDASYAQDFFFAGVAVKRRCVFACAGFLLLLLAAGATVSSSIVIVAFFGTPTRVSFQAF